MEQDHLKKVIVVQLAKKFPVFYRTRSFITVFTSQQPATGPYSEPDESSSHSHNLYKIQFNVILPFTPNTSRQNILECKMYYPSSFYET
jgi:hypothetical protein